MCAYTCDYASRITSRRRAYSELPYHFHCRVSYVLASLQSSVRSYFRSQERHERVRANRCISAALCGISCELHLRGFFCLDQSNAFTRFFDSDAARLPPARYLIVTELNRLLRHGTRRKNDAKRCDVRKILRTRGTLPLGLFFVCGQAARACSQQNGRLTMRRLFL